MGNRELIERIKSYRGEKIRIMEVCGTHTHEIFKNGIRAILPSDIELISGPGCPVCVTEETYIDEALWLSMKKGVTVCSFGDLIRVPGSEMSLAKARSCNAKVRVVYSPIDAVNLAIENRDEDFAFLSTGFETTTPSSCLALKKALDNNLSNFSLLTANKTMFNAYLSLSDSVDAFMYPGHVSTMTGMEPYYKLRDEYGISGSVTGFEADEILLSIDRIIEGVSISREAEKNTGVKQPFAYNCYSEIVPDNRNEKAAKLIDRFMVAVDAEWRGIGIIKDSGLKLRDEYKDFDARIKYEVPKFESRNYKGCRCGDVLLGKIKPTECPLFGNKCIPINPIGACMVSGEGTCSAYYKYSAFERY